MLAQEVSRQRLDKHLGGLFFLGDGRRPERLEGGVGDPPFVHLHSVDVLPAKLRALLYQELMVELAAAALHLRTPRNRLQEACSPCGLGRGLLAALAHQLRLTLGQGRRGGRG